MAIATAWLLGMMMTTSGSVELKETPRADRATHVLIEMKAEGELRPGPAPGGGETPKPVPLKAASRLDFIERGLATGPRGRAARLVRQAVVAIETSARPMLTQLRGDRALLIAERQDSSVRSFSPYGPLSRPELDLVQAAADPLVWDALLPTKAVAVGDAWDIPAAVAQSLSDYDALASNTLRAQVEILDDDVVRVRLAGSIQGAARGGEGTVTVDGFFTFDRKAGWIDRMSLSRSETRKPGPIEPGFKFTGTLTVSRAPASIPPELADTAIGGLPSQATPGQLLLQFDAPDGAYRLLHDRDWHLFWDDAKVAVLKRLEHGDLVAQCNLSIGPRAGKGRHQDPGQFREDIRKALGTRFEAVLGVGEIDGAEEGGYRYRVAVQGKEGTQGIVWYYYLIASPDGDQLLATFTLNAADTKRFGNQDLALISSLEWKPGATEKAAAAP